jgi:acetyl-CoA acetyltransferase
VVRTAHGQLQGATPRDRRRRAARERERQGAEVRAAGAGLSTSPVIVGVGQVTHRDDDDLAPAEPLALLLAAARAAETDAGARVLDHVDGIDLMPIGAWPYDDLAGLVVERLGLDAARVHARVHPVGGETPVRALDAAASLIAHGETRVVLVAGAEGTRAVTRARGAGVELPWTPRGSRSTIPTMGPELQRAAAVGIERAIHCFPLYEHALRAHEGLTLDDAGAESNALWAGLSSVAAANPYAWTRDARDAATVGTVGPHNRMVSFPYPKTLTANPFVNQGAALLVTDTDTARELGIPAHRWVYPLGGAGADEPTDPRTRRAYHRVPALEETVRDAQEVTGTAASDYDVIELYSCFPAMPKLTRRALGRDATAPISVTGGLSFFGGPGSNYLTHSLAAMVEHVRREGGTGFVHGVGMFNTKHHALVLSDHPRADGAYPRPAHDVGAPRPPVEAPVSVVEDYEGAITLLTCTVTFDRDGVPDRGGVIGTGRRGERVAAAVRDRETLHELTSGTEPVGREGTVTLATVPEFRI